MNVNKAFSILGLPSSAKRKEVKKKFRQQALLWHPDKNKAAGAEERFKTLNNAYQTLMENLIEANEAPEHVTEPGYRDNNSQTPDQTDRHNSDQTSEQAHRNNNTRTSEQKQSGSQDANLFTQFRPAFIHLAKNTGSLSESRKAELFTLLTRHQHFLTWALDDNGDTFLHYVFAVNNSSIINQLVSLPEWDTLSKTKNTKYKSSLFDQIAAFGQEKYYDLLKPSTADKSRWIQAAEMAITFGQKDFLKRLLTDGVDPDAKYGHYPNPILTLAASEGQAKICTLLLESGANPELKTYSSENKQTAEQCWSGSKETNPFSLLRRELVHLAKNTGDLSEPRKAELFTLITRHQHFLTWALDNNGYTFLHYVFAVNNSSLINQLVSLPEWDTLSKTKNTKNNGSLFDEIAAFGREKYYDLLKPSTADKSRWLQAAEMAVTFGQKDFLKRLMADGVEPDAKYGYYPNPILTLAARKGQANICTLLLESGANPELKTYSSENKKTAEQCWSGSQETNPFSLLRRELVHLAKNTGDLSEPRKAELFTLITRHQHFLTWALNDDGYTFLHHVFIAKNASLINKLVSLPEWDALAKTENIRNKKRPFEGTKSIIQLFEEWRTAQSLAKLGIFSTAADEYQGLKQSKNNEINAEDTGASLSSSQSQNPEF